MGTCSCKSDGPAELATRDSSVEPVYAIVTSDDVFLLDGSSGAKQPTLHHRGNNTFAVLQKDVSTVKPTEAPQDDFVPAACAHGDARLSAFRDALKAMPRSPKKAKDPFEMSGDMSTMYASFDTSVTDDSLRRNGGDNSALSKEAPDLEDHSESESGDDDVLKDNELPDYGSPKFWREVYTGVSKWRKCIPSEWLLSYSQFKAQKWDRYLRGGPILDLGCGNSEFASEAYDDGFRDITCADIDQCVIDTMRVQNAATRPGIKYIQCDARNMRSLGAGSFDIIFDKSTMDALLCSGKEATRECSFNVHRLLSDTGLYLCVSFGHPDRMKIAIKETGDARRQWKVAEVLTCYAEEESDDGRKQRLYMYVCRKVPVGQQSNARD